MKITRIIQVLCVTGLIIVQTVQTAWAQEWYRNEFSANVGVGMPSLSYKPTIGTQSSEFGAGFGISYSFFFSRNVGLSIGADLASYNAKTTGDNLPALVYQIANPPGTPASGTFELRADYTGYEETQKATFLQIPVMLQFQIPVGKQYFYFAGGAKIARPFSSSYTASATSITTKGYSSFTGQVYENMPKYGFATYTNPDMPGSDTKLELENANLIAAEIGMKWALSDKVALYTGFYLDYGLNSVTKKTAYDLLVYNPAAPQEYTYNSLLQSQSEPGKPFVDKVSLMAFGLKLRLSVGAGFVASRKVTKEPAPVVVPVVVKESPKTKDEALIKEQQIMQEQKALFDLSIGGYLSKASVLNSKQQAHLDYRIAILKTYPSLKITIEGYSDNLEGDVFAQSRADYAKGYMVTNGIAESRITTVNRGNCCPLLSNTSELNRTLNRRILIVIQ
ncbi:MAG: OmpA family protein [Candidatus Symbiothrix sp.]|jgi:outer membrane protein OmpA-like peptidoglycan-associated protein|nr:OmpA family protein [Candidatus Symbiothrix sp.]